MQEKQEYFHMTTYDYVLITHDSVKGVWMFFCSMNPGLCVKA